MGPKILPANSSPSKGRSENWSRQEIDCLVSAIEPYYAKLYGKLTNSCTAKTKNTLWAIIADKVNASGTVRRDIKSVKSKLKDMKSRAKEAASRISISRNKTGGGEGEEEDDIDERFSALQDWQIKIVKLLQIESIDGIKSGIDVNQQAASINVKRRASSDSEDDDSAETSNDLKTPTATDSGVYSKRKSVSSVTTLRKKKQVKEDMKIEDISSGMLEVQKEVLAQNKRIAEALEERNFLKKIELNLNPFHSAKSQVTLGTNSEMLEQTEDEVL